MIKEEITAFVAGCEQNNSACFLEELIPHLMSLQSGISLQGAINEIDDAIASGLIEIVTVKFKKGEEER
jgi:hypothetical protein